MGPMGCRIFFDQNHGQWYSIPPKIKQSIGQIDHNVRKMMFDFTPQKTGHGHLPVRNLKFCNSHVKRFPKAWGYPNSWMVLENPIYKWMIWGTLILGNQFHDTRVKFFLVRFRCSSDWTFFRGKGHDRNQYPQEGSGRWAGSCRQFQWTVGQISQKYTRVIGILCIYISLSSYMYISN